MNNPAASGGASKIMTSRKWLEGERKPLAPPSMGGARGG